MEVHVQNNANGSGAKWVDWVISVLQQWEKKPYIIGVFNTEEKVKITVQISENYDSYAKTTQEIEDIAFKLERLFSSENEDYNGVAKIRSRSVEGDRKITLSYMLEFVITHENHP